MSPSNWFRQHIPNFVDVVDAPSKIPFNTAEELLALEVVHRHRAYPGFYHFALSDCRLMAIYDLGFRWWVVGYVGNPGPLAPYLPKWDRGRYRALLENGSVVELPGSEVAASCGVELMLCDGTKAKNLRA